MVRLVCFADERMTNSQELCVSSSLKYGVECTWPYKPETISWEFQKFNHNVFAQDRGYGYWIWKPYVIYQSILNSNEGDILIYADSGVEFTNHVKHIIEKMDEDIFFFSNGHRHVEWCKADVLDGVLHIDEWLDFKFELFAKAQQQLQASVIFFKINQKTRDFVKEWLLWCQMPGFIDDSPSKLPNYPTFAEHRHDQAILTCLQIKYGYKQHWWPDKHWDNQQHRWPDDHYPIMFNHHRKRNNEW